VFTAATAVGDTYEIHPPHFHPSQLDDILNERLRNFHAPVQWPLSFYDSGDNDMELTGTSVWTGANSTLAKSGQYYKGAQSLSVEATSADGYADTTDWGAPAGKSFYVGVSLSGSTAGDAARVRVIDLTNGNATVAETGSISSAGLWANVVLPFTVPATCNFLEFRLMSVASGDVTLWDDFQVWAQHDALYALPDWISREEQVVDVVAFPLGSPQDDYVYGEYQTEAQQVRWSYSYTNPRTLATGPWLFVPEVGMRRPYVIARRPLDEVSSDYPASSGTANLVPLASDEADAIVKGAAAEALRRLSDHETGDKQDRMVARARELQKTWDAKLEQMNAVGKVIHHKKNTRVGAVMR
jgi:hypothetical protein